jgi:hypothetical protein
MRPTLFRVLYSLVIGVLFTLVMVTCGGCQSGAAQAGAGNVSGGAHIVSPSAATQPVSQPASPQTAATAQSGWVNYAKTVQNAVPYALVVLLLGLGTILTRAQGKRDTTLLELAKAMHDDNTIVELVKEYHADVKDLIQKGARQQAAIYRSVFRSQSYPAEPSRDSGTAESVRRSFIRPPADSDPGADAGAVGEAHPGGVGVDTSDPCTPGVPVEGHPPEPPNSSGGGRST